MKRLQLIETSALTEEQIHVLRTRILPSLEEMTKGHFSWYLPGPEQKQEAVRVVKHDWAVMTWLLQAIVSKGTQAQRARNLMRNLSQDHVPRWRAADPYKQYILAYNRTIKLIAAKKINPEAAKVITTILQSTDFQLLKKSWHFIIDEAGLSPTTIQELKTKNKLPTMKTFLKIMEQFHLRISIHKEDGQVMAVI
jgi:hypothetical protein